MKFTRIHIVGAPGSGKTHLGRSLAAQRGVKLTELDDLHWMNENNTYGTKRAKGERDALLADVIQRPTWVIEGIYYKWTATSFAEADLIIILQPNSWVRNWQLLWRFIKGKNSAQKTWRDFYALWHWANTYSRHTLPQIIELTEPYAAKRKIFSSADAAMLALGQPQGAI